MRKFNIQNYVRYKNEVEASIKRVKKPIDGDYTDLTNPEIIINFLPLCTFNQNKNILGAHHPSELYDLICQI